MKLYGISNCTTVKKARAWLAARNVVCEFHDFKRQGVPAALLDWTAMLGWERLINRQGTTWRKLDTARQQSVVDADSAIQLMTQWPSVIRRPLVEWPDGRVTLGFDEADWQARL